MAETLRSDGKAVEVTLVRAADAPVEKGDVVLQDGFFGIAMNDGVSGDVISLEISQREHEINVGASISAAKGAILYLAANGAISTTTSDTPFMKVTVAKDANNFVWGILLPQA